MSDLKTLHDRWKKYLSGEPVAEVATAYPTKQTGLEEIRSHDALEALIVSLAPSAEKERLTKRCLAMLYQLDALPADPANPARLCSPDTYTAGFLANLTGVAEPHDAAWWKSWWNENHDRLRWDADTARLRLAPPPT